MIINFKPLHAVQWKGDNYDEIVELYEALHDQGAAYPTWSLSGPPDSLGRIPVDDGEYGHSHSVGTWFVLLPGVDILILGELEFAKLTD